MFFIDVIQKVTETDPLPKFVCLDCWNQVDNFNRFHERVHASQTNYLKQLIKCERENHFIEIPPLHVNVDAAFATDQIDELRETNGLSQEAVIKLEYESCKNPPLSPSLVSIEMPDQMNNESIDDDMGDDDGDALEDDNCEINSSYAQSEDDENESGSDEEYSNKASELISTKRIYTYPKKQFICDYCGLNLSSKHRLLEHLLRHIKYMCNICSERYVKRHDILYSIPEMNQFNAHHFRCNSRRSLETHNKVNHSAGTYHFQ